jgi:hypothetical protein
MLVVVLGPRLEVATHRSTKLEPLSESGTAAGRGARMASDKRRLKLQHILDSMPAQIDAIKAKRASEVRELNNFEMERKGIRGVTAQVARQMSGNENQVTGSIPYAQHPQSLTMKEHFI